MKNTLYTLLFATLTITGCKGKQDGEPTTTNRATTPPARKPSKKPAPKVEKKQPQTTCYITTLTPKGKAAVKKAADSETTQSSAVTALLIPTSYCFTSFTLVDFHRES